MRRPLSNSKFAQLSAATMLQLGIQRSGAACSVTVRRGIGPAFSRSGAVALAIFIGAAARAIPPLLAGVIQRDLNWSESEISWPIAISIAASALAAPLAAIGLQRIGVRRLIFGSLVLLAVSLTLSSFAASPWHLLLFWGVGVGLSGSLSASVLGAVIGSRDHAAHCGATFGFFTSTQFLGSAVGVLLASRVIDTLGWRFVLEAAAFATLVAALFIGSSLRGSSGKATPERGPVARIASPNAFIGNFQFWIFAAIFFICGASTTGLLEGRLGNFCMGNGLGLLASADVLAIVALAGVIGSAASGLLADRYSPRILLAGYFTARAIALFWLPFTDLSFLGLAEFGAFFGLDAALTFPVLVKLLSKNFDGHVIGMVMSWVMAAHIVGAAGTSALIGFIGLASYAVSLTLVGFMCLLATALVQIFRE